MMPKLAIYVPKKQMKLIEKWRKRMNFSQVFMRALEAEIEAQNSSPSTEERVASAAAYYRQHMDMAKQTPADFGFQLGRRHVFDCQIPAEHIPRLLELSDTEKPTDKDYQWISQTLDADRDECDSFLDKKGIPVDSGKPADDYVQASRSIGRGYVRGVAQAWQKLCEQM